LKLRVSRKAAILEQAVAVGAEETAIALLLNDPICDEANFQKYEDL